MIHPDTLAALGAKNVEWLVLVRLELDEGALCFSNLVDDIVFEGFVYQGMGNLGDIGQIAETAALDPQWMDIVLSGVTAELLQAALVTNYFNRPVYVHLGCLGDADGYFWNDTELSWNDLTLPWGDGGIIIGEPFQVFAGTIDSINCAYGAASYIEISCADELADWEREKIERYTDQDQQARYPGDTGFRFVAQVSTREVVWPARNWFVARA